MPGTVRGQIPAAPRRARLVPRARPARRAPPACRWACPASRSAAVSAVPGPQGAPRNEAVQATVQHATVQHATVQQDTAQTTAVDGAQPAAPPVIAVVGPTGSGKSDLAVSL